MDQIGIINLGLGLISQRTIESLTEGSVQANAANDVWVPCVQECLRGNNWSFASVEQVLALVANATLLNWKYVYAYPANAMAVWKVYNTYTADQKKGEDFKEYLIPTLGVKVIATNCQNAYVEYTYYVQDTTIFDPSFVTMLSYRLAASLAMPLNADAEQAMNMTKVFENQMSEAQRMSSYENNVLNGESPDALINSRMSGLSGNIDSVSIGGVTFQAFNAGQTS